MSNLSVKDKLLKDHNKMAELEVFLGMEFGTSSQSEPNKILHGEIIEIQYSSSGGGVSDIVVTSPEHIELVNSLEQKIDVAIYADHGIGVSKDYVFFRKPVEKQFRYLDDFQIIPLPPQCPRATEILADHPAIIEFSYPSSSHALIDSHRREERRRELFETLNVLIFTGMSWRSDFLKKHWVYAPKTNENEAEIREIKSIYCQEGYSCNDNWKNVDAIGFSIEKSWSEIEEISAKNYYNQLGIIPGDPFYLPDSFRDSLRIISNLNSEESKLFQRSAHWLRKSSEVYTQSHSLSYCSLVYVLEGLIEKPEKSGTCASCKRDLFDKSISQRFRELLDRYGANLPKSDIDYIYRIRSSIAHGGGLMPRDREITGFRFNADQNAKDAVFRKLQYVCQTVLLNWLHSPERAIS